MRMVVVILALAAIAIGRVSLMRDAMVARHEVQRLQQRLIEQRRQLWDQDVRLGQLQAPHALRVRAEDMGVSLAAPGDGAGPGPAGAGPR